MAGWRTESKRSWRAVAAIAAVACLLAACGSNGNGGDEPTPNEPTNEETPSDNEVTSAASTFPEKSIDLIVPFPAGGGADTAARTLQPSLEETLGESVVILNKGGGGGAVGTAQAAAADADGHTWLLITIGPATTQPHLQDVPYDPSAFVPVTLVNNEPLALVVPTESSIQDLDDLKAAASSGDLTWAAPPIGGVPHLTGELILQALDGSARMVPFDGTGPATTAVLGNQIDVASLPVAQVISHIEGGLLRAIAVTAAERVEGLPDLPTFTELGVDVVVTNWNGIAMPAGTPDDVVAQVYEALQAAIEDAKYQTLLEQTGVGLSPVTPEEFADIWQRDFDRFGDLIETLKQQGTL